MQELLNQYKNWLKQPYSQENTFTVIITSYHTTTYTIKLLESLKRNIEKMPNISTEVLVYEDHRENDLLQKYVENVELDNWYYFAVPEELSTNDSMYGRSEGIKRATGKYLTFLDGDDLLTSKAYKAYLKSIELLENDEKLLIARFGEILVKEINREKFSLNITKKENIAFKHLKHIHKNYTLSLPEYLSFSKHIRSYAYYMWNKVFRADYLKTLRIYLEERYVDIQIWLENACTGIVNIIGYIHFFGSDEHLQHIIAKSRREKDARYEREQALKKQFIDDYKDKVEKHYSNTLKTLFSQIERSAF